VSAPHLTVVVPAHNEEERLARTLADLREQLPGAEIIVVANSCRDATVAIATDAARSDLRMQVLDVGARIGKGGAVRLGFQIARGDVVAFVDADGATPGAEVKRLYQSMGNADCIVATRWGPGAVVQVAQSRWRRFLGRGFNLLVRLLFGLHFTDTQCGAKFVRRAALEGILDDLETAGFAFDVDLLFQLMRHGRTIVEAPIVWRDCSGSKVNVWIAVPRMLTAMLRLRLKYSPLRVLVPWLDRLGQLEIIRCRRALRVLVVSDAHPLSAQASSLERSVQSAVSGLAQSEWSAVWSYSLPLALVEPFPEQSALRYERRTRSLASTYLRDYRDRFDCVVEVCRKRYYWTPLFSMKPKVVIAPGMRGSSPVYGRAIRLNAAPLDATMLERALFNAIAAYHAHFVLQRDGTWSLLTHADGRQSVFVASALPVGTSPASSILNA